MKDTRKAVITDLPQLAELFDQYRIFYHKSSDIPAASDFYRKELKIKTLKFSLQKKTEF
ncbi:hypothetical protein [Chryseobacterium contaminans]|uniref:Uncharacterized protein n=1 Tax=Chryseobacterium contaminans TaxID=1423959 RepID=A0A1M7EMK3_9FLAO|nr:hypothetical protein SAMN05444407_107250 [Chryseobacterium contaminans]